MMYSFLNDYSEGAHDNIIKALLETNHEVTVGYGMDDYCKKAKYLIQNEIQNDVDIHFVCGGTQANLLVISHILRPYEAVIACDSGHINVHEAGSIEATGHKVLFEKGVDGKLTINAIEKILQLHKNEHMVMPKMVYISNTTEIGSTYSKNEIKELYEYCQKHNLYLFIDGARLANALAVEELDLTLADISKYSDVFYFGGTKNGALFGEVIIFNNKDIAKDFRYSMKQKGSILAKGRLLGIQFIELFKDQLYLKLASLANSYAMRIQDNFLSHGVKMLTNAKTNQIFPILSNEVIEILKEKYLFEDWEEYNETHRVVRFVTSWDTKEEVVNELLVDLNKIYN